MQLQLISVVNIWWNDIAQLMKPLKQPKKPFLALVIAKRLKVISVIIQHVASFLNNLVVFTYTQIVLRSGSVRRQTHVE